MRQAGGSAQESGPEPPPASRHHGIERALSARQFKAAKARTNEVVKEVERRRLDAVRLARQSSSTWLDNPKTAPKGPSFGADAASELGADRPLAPPHARARMTRS